MNIFKFASRSFARLAFVDVLNAHYQLVEKCFNMSDDK